MSDIANKTVKETVTTMTSDGPKSTFARNDETVDHQSVSPELMEATNEVMELKLNHSKGLSPVQAKTKTLNQAIGLALSVGTAIIPGAHASSLAGRAAQSAGVYYATEAIDLNNALKAYNITRTRLNETF